jgi:hypothetical protein
MAHRLALSVLLSAAALSAPIVPAWSAAQQPAPPPPATPASTAVHRVTLSAGAGKDLPYSIEVPRDWTMRQEQGYPGLFVGPADAKPEDPRLIWVRGSQVSLADPAQVAANIRASDAQADQWTAPRVEEKEVGGVEALLVRLDTQDAKNPGTTRSTLILKLPLGPAGLDVVASADKAEMDRRMAEYERILLSVRPVAAPATPPAAPPAPKKE